MGKNSKIIDINLIILVSVLNVNILIILIKDRNG